MRDREIALVVQKKLAEALAELVRPAEVGEFEVEVVQPLDRRSYILTARVEIRPEVTR